MKELITGKYTIKQIFKDHWASYLLNHKPSEHIIKTVNKMLNCREPSKIGYHKYSCRDHPGEITLVPHSCKSKFCNICGAWQTDKWMTKAMEILPETTYYHITLTIPDYLWYFLRDNMPLLDLLFKASAEAVQGWFKERNIIPAICSGMHTFGKQINFNSHIHMIVSTGGLFYKKGKPSWKVISFFPFKNMLRSRWRAILLKKLKPFINPELKEFLYSIDWYVFVKLDVMDIYATCRYIGRYSKKPPLAETRITNYDGEFVTFSFKEREKPRPSFLKLHNQEFITRLIQHILPPQFRVIRYYGILANCVRNKYQKIVSKIIGQIKKHLPLFSWRKRQLNFKGTDPLACPICGRDMVLTEIAFPSRFGGLAYKFF